MKCEECDEPAIIFIDNMPEISRRDDRGIPIFDIDTMKTEEGKWLCKKCFIREIPPFQVSQILDKNGEFL